MSCPAPLDAAILADYWLAALPLSEEDSVEQHLFQCGECGTRLRETIALAEAVRDIARQGSLFMIVSDNLLESAAREGLRVRQYTLPAGGAVACTVTAEDDLLIARLTANLTSARRIDLCLYDDTGRERSRFTDIPFRSDAPTVLFQHAIQHAKAAPTETLIARLLAIDDAGEHLLGEYTFHHTRTLPGPGSHVAG